VQQQIDAFKQSEFYTFAPQTIKRADAYLGAAILASEQQKTADANNAIHQAQEKLTEAKQTATSFMNRFEAMINSYRDAFTVIQIIAATEQVEDKPSTQHIIKPAQREFNQAILKHEQGQLNQSQAHANKAKEYARNIIINSLPRLTELTARAMGKAANSSAKKYAPQIYQVAKDKLTELRTFNDGLSHVIPSHPEQGLYLARAARQMSEQVKLWRKNASSHEQLKLKQQTLHLQLANALHISTKSNPMLIDIPGDDLLAAILKTNKALADERLAHQQSIKRLQQQSAEQLKLQLAAQSDTIMQQQQQQMGKIKDAFRAKLERETFDKNRQQKLHTLFKPDEVEILINLDGSLLIRLSGLKFAPARSKIDAKYFDMLEQLNAAMAIYQDRNFHIEGHTDSIGDVKANQLLSLQRAEAVRDFLIASGADGSRLKALGYGEVRPISSNEFAQGRSINRRIDVVINAKQ